MSSTLGDEQSTATTTTNQEPWGPQQPYLTRGFGEAAGLLDGGPQSYYPGQTVADTTAATTAGQNAMMDGAAASNTLRNATVSGAFLDQGNPHFQQMVGQIGQAIRPGIDSAFASSGRLGSGAHANAYASALADKAGNLAFQNYGVERQNQMQAGQDYSPYQAFMQVGQQQQQQTQAQQNDALQRWNFEQGAPQQALNNYMNVVGNRSYGGTGTTNTPYTSNPTMQALGTGASLAGALGQFASGTRGLLW
jgi:hypothetical protein